MDKELESNIDVLADKFNLGFKENYTDDIEIHGSDKETQSFDSGKRILKITPTTALPESTALKNMHNIKTLSSEEGKTSWINDEPMKPASRISSEIRR